MQDNDLTLFFEHGIMYSETRNNAIKQNEVIPILYFNAPKLRGKIVEKGMSQEMIAKQIGIDQSTFYRKMKADGLTFSVGEMHKIVKILDLNKTEATEIFLAEISQ